MNSPPKPTGKNGGPIPSVAPAEIEISSSSQTSSLDRGLSPKRTEYKPPALPLTAMQVINSATGPGGASIREEPYVKIAPDLTRDTLGIKVGEMVSDDLSNVLIWPMLDLVRNEEAMVQRVKDLLGQSIAGDDVVLGEPFIAEHPFTMAVVDDKSLCGILVTTESSPGKIRVADLANLKPQTEKYAVGYGEFDVDDRTLFGPYIMIVKPGQSAVIEGRPTLRFFVRVVPGTPEYKAKPVAEDAWTFRTIICKEEAPVWHEYFTNRRQ